MSKYAPLQKFLEQQRSMRVVLPMEEIEKIIGDTLPKSAYRYVQWWSNSNTSAHPYSRAWTDAGFHTVRVLETIRSQKIIFER